MANGMDIVSLLLLAVGLSMDVLSVAAITGLGLGKMTQGQMSKLAFSFGVFHTFMPVIGWLAGATIVGLISGYDHWAAFALLVFVGGRMLFEGVRGEEVAEPEKILETGSLLFFSLAVSIDSIAVGLSFSLEKVQIMWPAVVIGITAFVFTYIGVYLGNKTGPWLGKYAQVIGGVILVGIGIRVLLSHIIF